MLSRFYKSSINSQLPFNTINNSTAAITKQFTIQNQLLPQRLHCINHHNYQYFYCYYTSTTIFTMKRPSDQAKLIFVGLLRTVSALATTNSESRSFGISFVSSSSSSTFLASTSSPYSSSSYNRRLVPNNNNNNNNNNNKNRLYYDDEDDYTNEQNEPSIVLRIGRPKDVPAISDCNLATLPENYNHAFYTNHMRQWPNLVIVAVLENDSNQPPPQQQQRRRQQQQRQQQSKQLQHQDNEQYFNEFDYRSNTNNVYDSYNAENDDDYYYYYTRKAPHLNYHPNKKSTSTVVAYVLGKVEERLVPIEQPQQRSQFRRQLEYTAFGNNNHHRPAAQQYTTECIGHVTSLAVLEPYRRRGLAAELMNQLHYHLEHYTSSSSSSAAPITTMCGLHVRQSNYAAAKLYERFGYTVSDTIPCYYQDGEDAYYMTRNINTNMNTNLVDDHQEEQQLQTQYEYGDIRRGNSNNNDDGHHRAGFLSNIMFRRNNNKNNQQQMQHHSGSSGFTSGSAGFFSRKQQQQSLPWEYGPPHLRLPRPVGSKRVHTELRHHDVSSSAIDEDDVYDDSSIDIINNNINHKKNRNDNNSNTDSSNELPELLTGTM